jgi:hypothetical protein
MPEITLQYVQIDTRSPDTEGLLAFADGRLVAVLMRLSEDLHAGSSFSGSWCVEIGFGPCTIGFVPVILHDVDAVSRWVAEQMAEDKDVAGEARDSD